MIKVITTSRHQSREPFVCQPGGRNWDSESLDGLNEDVEVLRMKSTPETRLEITLGHAGSAHIHDTSLSGLPLAGVVLQLLCSLRVSLSITVYVEP
jgi:hypothetical protein